MKKILMSLRPVVAYMFLIGCICNLLLLSTTIYVMQVFDRVLSSGSVETLWALTAMTLCALVLLAALQAGRIWMLSRVTEWLERKLEGSLFLHAVNDKDLITPLNTLKGYLTSQGFIALIDLPWSLVFVGVLFILHPYLGWLAVFGIVVITAMAWLSFRYNKPLLDSYQRHLQRSTLYLHSARESADTLRSMGDLDAVEVTWREMNAKAQDAWLSLAKRQIMLSETGRFFRLSLQIAVTGIGAYLVLKNGLSVGGIIVGSMLLGRALSPVEMTLVTWTHLLGAYRAYSLLKKIRDDAIPRKGALFEEGDFIVDAVSFATGGVPILKDISFTLKRGGLLVLMGHTGAGKSTLIKIMAGILEPTEGTAGRGRSIGYAPQGGVFFPGTVAQNIARMSLSPDMDAVREATHLLGADWIDDLPYGHDTPLNLRTLSPGQHQQLILARAWYGNPRLLLLDEPDVYLDESAGKCLMEGLAHAKSLKATTVVVTRNPEIIKMADHVLVLRYGRVVAFGDTAILM
jgi:ABC-type protease/lipase transport system fused ATPase/permease subunit